VYEEGRDGRPDGDHWSHVAEEAQRESTADAEPGAENPYHYPGGQALDLSRIRLLHKAIARLTRMAVEDVEHHPYQEMIPRPLRDTLFQLAQAVEELGKEVETEKLDPPF